MENPKIRQAAQAIRAADSILLCCHLRPDGDALGSLIGLGLACEELGKRVAFVSPDGVPALYRFLPHSDRVRTSPDGAFDIAIGLDADGAHRLGAAESAVMSAPFVIDIDHHTGPRPFGNLQIVEPTAAATGELVYKLICELGTAVTPEIATCLMAAILTDTGSFRYPNVTPETLRIAADLLEKGGLPTPIFEAIYEQQALPAVRLRALALSRAQVEASGRLAWCALSQADFTTTGTTSEDTEGIINDLRAIAGVRVALLIREEPCGELRVSLRSRDATDVAQIAIEFGGGGHRAAAGCSLPGPLAAASARVVASALRVLDDGVPGQPA